MKIDAHQHFWRIARGDYGWLTPELGPLWRDFEPSDLAPLASAAGVERTIVVQAAPTLEETHYLLALASGEPLVGGVVGWVPLLDAEAPLMIEQLSRQRKFRGVRPMLQDLAEDDWILNPSLEPAIAALVTHNLVFDALVHVRHLPFLAEFAGRHPKLRIVIDHAAKPRFVDQTDTTHDWHQWADRMALLARLHNVYCKLSGLVTEAPPGYRDDTFARHFDHLVSQFGAQRLMWCSDWPVLNLNGNYAAWRACALRLTARLTESERAAIFGDTARAFYGL